MTLFGARRKHSTARQWCGLCRFVFGVLRIFPCWHALSVRRFSSVRTAASHFDSLRKFIGLWPRCFCCFPRHACRHSVEHVIRLPVFDVVSNFVPHCTHVFCASGFLRAFPAQWYEQYLRHEWLGFSFHFLPHARQTFAIRLARLVAAPFAARAMMISLAIGFLRPLDGALSTLSPPLLVSARVSGKVCIFVISGTIVVKSAS